MKKNHYILVAAIIIALGAGYGVAHLTDEANHSSHDGEEQHDHDDDDESHGADDHSEEGVVHLTPRQIEASAIAIVPVRVGGGAEVRLTGRVEPVTGARVSLSPAVSGIVEKIEVGSGEIVKAGQLIAYVVSGEAALLKAEADARKAEAEAIRLAYRRDVNLERQGVIARQELEGSHARWLAADAVAKAAYAGLQLSGSPDIKGRIAIKSPINGVAGSFRITEGGFVSAETTLVEIVDQSRTEFVFSVPPALISRLSIGMKIYVSADDEEYEAEIVGVTGTAGAGGVSGIIRAQTTTKTYLTPGSSIEGSVVTGERDGHNVPVDAVQMIDGQSVVFIREDDGFRATPVLVGGRAGETIEIVKGLSGSEMIAGRNAFLLKAELAKGDVEHSH